MPTMRAASRLLGSYRVRVTSRTSWPFGGCLDLLITAVTGAATPTRGKKNFRGSGGLCTPNFASGSRPAGLWAPNYFDLFRTPKQVRERFSGEVRPDGWGGVLIAIDRHDYMIECSLSDSRAEDWLVIRQSILGRHDCILLERLCRRRLMYH